MQADIIYVGNILVAGVAANFRRVGYYSFMGAILVSVTAIPAVADNTADHAVGALHKIGILEEDLLPYLQRR